jgi:phosphotriesterase-related protein
MTRRDLLKVLGSALGASPWFASSLGTREDTAVPDASSLDAEGQIMTVTGPIPPEEMGTALPHEHVFHRFGDPPARHPDYDLRDVFDTVVPILNAVQSLGCDAIMGCTAAYFGRDPLIMHRLAELTGLHLITNTGYYGAVDDRYVPEHAYDERAAQLAKRWLAEWTDGVDGTGIRPGFIKTAVDSGPLSDIDRKLVRAAAKTHRESGLTIAVHTSDNVPAAREQLTVLDEEGVDPSAWIWVHAQNVSDVDALAEAAKQGAWLEFDGLAPGDEMEHHLELVQAMQERDLLDRVLLSHDESAYPSDGPDPRPFDPLFRTFLPKLRSAGVSDETIRRLTVENPRRAFTVQVRT